MKRKRGSDSSRLVITKIRRGLTDETKRKTRMKTKCVSDSNRLVITKITRGRWPNQTKPREKQEWRQNMSDSSRLVIRRGRWPKPDETKGRNWLKASHVSDSSRLVIRWGRQTRREKQEWRQNMSDSNPLRPNRDETKTEQNKVEGKTCLYLRPWDEAGRPHETKSRTRMKAV